MALYKIKDVYPDYRDQFGDHDILSYSLYAGSNQDKVGSVDDLLVDEEGRFRYLVINTGAWIFGKKVLLPIGQARIDYNDRRVYATGLSREQVENLPEYDPNSIIDYDYEERVRNVYRPSAYGSAAYGSAATGSTATGSTATSSAATTAGLNASPALESQTSLDTTPGLTDQTTQRSYNRDNYRYDYDPNLYGMKEQDHQNLRLYEERLIAGKTRQKTGEVAVSKHVETETQRVSVPVERERVVIERVEPTDRSTAPVVGTDAFQEGEVVRMDVYEETPDIRKEAFVREEVRVRKEVEQDTVEAQETIRKERLDVDRDGNPLTRE
ncbi:MAG: DUF2382 domain-containing protein [Elainella sp. Prado103]|jgi:uncharacterized protein (TIGR02271 family)|nr:DUF2382 domain-containing protein [Elainella sp. Prado103]